MKRISRSVIYESEWINLYADRVQLKSGEIVKKYHQIDYKKESVVVLCSNDNDEILTIDSYRYSTGNIELELKKAQQNRRSPLQLMST